MSKRIIIIAGPNGAGKTTFANVFLPECSDIKYFLNADLIAKGLAHFVQNPLQLKLEGLCLVKFQSMLSKVAALQ